MAKLSKQMEEFEDDDLAPLVPLKEIAETALEQKLSAIDTHMQEQKEIKEDKQVKKNTQKQVNFRITEEEFEKYSKLFGGKGVSFSKAIRMWLDFGYDAIKNGKYDMSPYGIKENTLRSI
ncbi:MAG: hypothetical protein MJ185_02860 [Treponema sp.]|nr:hypothetical protein [Treponema sp.]